MPQLLVFDNEKNSFYIEKDTQLIAYHRFLQELQLWLSENPMKANLGVDYFGVFENRVSLKTKIQEIIDKHSASFKSLTLENSEIDLEKNLASISITCELVDSTILRKNLVIGAL